MNRSSKSRAGLIRGGQGGEPAPVYKAIAFSYETSFKCAPVLLRGPSTNDRALFFSLLLALSSGRSFCAGVYFSSDGQARVHTLSF